MRGLVVKKHTLLETKKMSNIRTIEDAFQYRVHRILKRLEGDLTGMSLKDYLLTRNGIMDLGEYLLEDIEQYCGLDEALENEY